MAGSGTVTELEPGGDNAIAVTLGILGDEWNLWILRYALQGDRRYRDWIERGEISNAVLTARLTRLTDSELLERVQYQTRPARHEYRLTARGHGVWPVLLTMWAWEQQWAPDHRGQLPARRHTVCAARFTPVLVCGHCDRPVGAPDVEAQLGPSGQWSRSVPAATGRRRSGRARSPEILPHTMELLGDRWSAALLGAAFLGATRYGQFAERMGAPPAVVAGRLRRFTELGVLEELPNPARPAWVTYHLTDKGRAFFPVVACMIDWGLRWFRAPEGPAIVLCHRECDHTFTPVLTCSHCGERLRASTVSIEPSGG